MDHNKILGVVLAGGKSQRFGEDKSQVKLNDKLLIDYILSEIIDQFNEILIISNNKIKFKHSTKITTTTDIIKGLGPLGGILTAMKWIKNNKKDYKWISTFPSDTPFFTKNELKIFGKEIINVQNKKIIVPNLGDHRICMSAFVLATLTGIEARIKNFETVFTSSPSFLKIMKLLGVKFEIKR